MKKTPDKKDQIAIFARDYTHYSRWIKHMKYNLQNYYFISNINVVKFIDHSPIVWVLDGVSDRPDHDEIVGQLQLLGSMIITNESEFIPKSVDIV